MSNPSRVYRMVVLDIDGTLLGHDGKVAEPERQAVRRLLDAGVLVAIATGRSFGESRFVLEQIGHFPPAVFVGGAMVVDTAAGSVMHRTKMDGRLAMEVCRLVERNGHCVLALQDHEVSDVDYLISRVNVHTESVNWFDKTGMTYRLTDDLGVHPHEHTVRLGVIGPAAEIEATAAEVGAVFQEAIFFHRIAVTERGLEVLEMFDPSVNKWEGIKALCRLHGVSEAEVIAVGDDVNDLHMVKGAGMGVAMGNARQVLKDVADRVIGLNKEHGLALFLNELLDDEMVVPI